MKKYLFLFFGSLTHFAIAMQSSYSNAINKNTQIIIEQGDITQSRVQAIVNAANEQLLGGAGVCGAIFNAAGWHNLQAACDIYTAQNTVRCPVGTACITDSFNLKRRGTDYIIHAVGPDCRLIRDEDKQNTLLQSAYHNSLQLADQHAIKAIAFPFISSAIYAFPKKRACEIALKTVINYAKNNQTTIDSIRFVLFSQDDFALFCDTLKIQ